MSQLHRSLLPQPKHGSKVPQRQALPRPQVATPPPPPSPNLAAYFPSPAAPPSKGKARESNQSDYSIVDFAQLLGAGGADDSSLLNDEQPSFLVDADFLATPAPAKRTLNVLKRQDKSRVTVEIEPAEVLLPQPVRENCSVLELVGPPALPTPAPKLVVAELVPVSAQTTEPQSITIENSRGFNSPPLLALAPPVVLAAEPLAEDVVSQEFVAVPSSAPTNESCMRPNMERKESSEPPSAPAPVTIPAPAVTAQREPQAAVVAAPREDVQVPAKEEPKPNAMPSLVARSLPAPAPAPVPAPAPCVVATKPVAVATAALKENVPVAAPRPSVLLQRPAHILPKDHPSHPRMSISRAPVPPLAVTVARVELPPAKVVQFTAPPPAPEDQPVVSSNGSKLAQARRSTIDSLARSASSASASPSSTSIAVALQVPAPVPAPAPAPASSKVVPRFSLAPPTFSPILAASAGDSSIDSPEGSGAYPRDTNAHRSFRLDDDFSFAGDEDGHLFGHAGRAGTDRITTSTPRVRADRPFTAAAATFDRPNARRETLAVTFALPEEIEEDEEARATSDVALEVAPAAMFDGDSRASVRRASRASVDFWAEPSTTLASSQRVPCSSSGLGAASTSRRASRVFVESASTPHDARPIASMPVSSRRSISQSELGVPMTVIRLAAGRVDLPAPPPPARPPLPTPAPTSTALDVEASLRQSSKAVKIALTLPRDFNFASRGADRDEERKRRRAEREKAEEADRKKCLRKVDGGKHETGKRPKLASSLPPSHSSRPSVPLPPDLRASAPARRVPSASISAPARQPRSRPTPATSTRRRSESAPQLVAAAAEEPIALTKAALEESLRFVGPKLDLKRRVSQYLEGVAEEDEEDGVEDGLHADAPPVSVEPVAVVPEAAMEVPAPSSEAPAPSHAALPSPAPVTRTRQTHPAEEVRVVARMPLVSRNTQNQNRAAPATIAAKPVSKPQPFTFTTTARRQPVPTSTSTSFDARLSAWQDREAATLPAGTARAKPHRVPNLQKRAKPTSTTTTKTGDRDSWDARQRAREEEVRKNKEAQRKLADEQEREKLKALRASLGVVKAHPVPNFKALHGR